MATGLNKDIEIAIIGGGLSGFAVSIMLKNNGFNRVTVYERDLCLAQRRQGYGLTLLQGVNAIKTLSPQVFERVKSLDTPSRSHYIFDNSGNIINFFGTIFWPATEETANTKKKNKKYNLHISRTNLRNIIHDESVERNVSIKWNYKLSKLQKLDNNRVSIEFSNGETNIADLVIGCDGIKSMARAFKYPPDIDMRLNYLGMIMVLGITYSDHSLTKARVFQTVDGCTRWFAMPYATEGHEHNFMWQLSFPLDEMEAKRLSADTKLLKDHILERCGDWHEPVPSMIKSTDVSLVMGIPAYDRLVELPETKLIESIALLGDAAHPMSPFKGQGANQALLDAVSLGNSLIKATSINEAITFYETEMIKRVRSKVELSRERVKSFHDPNILSSDSFEYRGANQELLKNLKDAGVNSQSGEEIEKKIMIEMRKLNII